MRDVCTLYRDAPRLAAQGERVLSTDELSGVQALERKHPPRPMRPGEVERQEFAYVRHGTCAFILNRDVVTGRIVAPSLGATRTEADFLAHVRETVAGDPTATRWHFVVATSTATNRCRWCGGWRLNRGWPTWTWVRRGGEGSWPGAARGRRS